MKTYRVEWSIDVEADTPLQAAHKALEIQRRRNSTAVVFTVFADGAHWNIDLLNEQQARRKAPPFIMAKYDPD